MEVIALKTKTCPFCSERIQAAAIKCRFCGEFLNTERAPQPSKPAGSQCSKDKKLPDNVLFAGRPSLWAAAGAVIKGLFFIALAVLLFAWPIEELTWLGFSENQVLAIAGCRKFAGIGIAIVVMLGLLIKIIKLKVIRYEVTADRIEHRRGIFDRKVDNMDMFRVIDLKLRRNLLDCIVGVGTVSLVTTDKTDPNFDFLKIRNARRLYDIIKKASLEADRQRGVFHLE